MEWIMVVAHFHVLLPLAAVSFCDILLDVRQQEGRGLISSRVVTPPWDIEYRLS